MNEARIESGEADPDEELVRRAGLGDPAAIQALVASKLRRILALAERMLGDAAEAEDVAQETFLRVWRHAPRWKPGAARFDTWLHRVTLNLCYDRLRRRRERPTAEPPDRPDPGPAPDRGLEAEDVGRRVRAGARWRCRRASARRSCCATTRSWAISRPPG